MNWIVSETALKELRKEAADTVMSVGNGRFCTRGTPADAYAAQGPPWPYRGTFPAGSFARAGFGLDWPMGAPDWTAARVNLPRGVVTDSARSLDLSTGILTHCWTVTAKDVVVTCREERFASWALPFLAAQRLTVTVNRGSPVEVVLGLDGDIRGNPGKVYKPGNPPSCDERGLRLTEVEACGLQDSTATVVLKALATENRTAARAIICQVSGPAVSCDPITQSSFAGRCFHGKLKDGATLVFEKVAAIAADLPGYDEAVTDRGRLQAIGALSFVTAMAEHHRVIDSFWDVADVRFAGDEFSTLATRFAVWSTRIAAPLDGGRASIGPKNLTGDWYRGLLFWDMDIFQLPLLAALCPDRACNHVAYRNRLLTGGRRLARQDGYAGARYPFASPPDAEERPAPRGVKGQQLHVNLAAAYAVLHAWRMTGSDAVMLDHGGLEVLLETARFWLSLVQEEADGIFHLRSITGPDELHGGIDDNYYTNEFLARVLTDTVDAARTLQGRAPEASGRVVTRCGWTARDEERAVQIAQRIARPLLPDGTPAQFAGFEKQPAPNCAIRNIWGAGDCTHKQADTVLLAQVDPQRTDRTWLERVYDAYVPLCTQTSSLSPGSHAIAAAMLGRGQDAEKFFRLAASMELDDSFANTAHGIHGAGQGGLWMAAVHGFGGLQAGPRGIAIAPALPPAWKGLDYSVFCRDGILRVKVRADEFTVKWEHDRHPVALWINGRAESLKSGETRSFAASGGWTPARLKAAILDLDGVIVSTDECHYRAWKELADELGIPFDHERNHALRGVSREESLRRIYGSLALPPPERFKELCDRKNVRYRQLVSEMTSADVLPGMRELLVELRRRGVKVAVASASRNAGLVLDRTGIADLFDAVVDGSMVTESKPDPQGFTLAAMRCRALPWECVGVEDSAAGVEAIRRAGMVAIGVGSEGCRAHECVDLPGQITADTLRGAIARHADNLVNPYRELNLAKLKTELANG